MWGRYLCASCLVLCLLLPPAVSFVPCSSRTFPGRKGFVAGHEPCYFHQPTTSEWSRTKGQTRRALVSAKVSKEKGATALATENRAKETGKGKKATPQATVAVLVDAENAHPELVDSVMEEVEACWGEGGVAVVKRAYADWTRDFPLRKSGAVQRHLLQRVHQQSSFTGRGRGSSNTLMVVDAMELLYNHPDISVFVLVTSADASADFSVVSAKLRRMGKAVHLPVAVGQSRRENLYGEDALSFMEGDGRCQAGHHDSAAAAEEEEEEEELGPDVETERRLAGWVLKAFQTLVEETEQGDERTEYRSSGSWPLVSVGALEERTEELIGYNVGAFLNGLSFRLFLEGLEGDWEIETVGRRSFVRPVSAKDTEEEEGIVPGVGESDEGGWEREEVAEEEEQETSESVADSSLVERLSESLEEDLDMLDEDEDLAEEEEEEDDEGKQERDSAEEEQQQGREKNERENGLREKEQREKEQREKEQREKEQKEKEQREKEKREKERREKEEKEKEERERQEKELELQRERARKEKELRRRRAERKQAEVERKKQEQRENNLRIREAKLLEAMEEEKKRQEDEKMEALERKRLQEEAKREKLKREQEAKMNKKKNHSPQWQTENIWEQLRNEGLMGGGPDSDDDDDATYSWDDEFERRSFESDSTVLTEEVQRLRERLMRTPLPDDDELIKDASALWDLMAGRMKKGEEEEDMSNRIKLLNAFLQIWRELLDFRESHLHSMSVEQRKDRMSLDEFRLSMKSPFEEFAKLMGAALVNFFTDY